MHPVLLHMQNPEQDLLPADPLFAGLTRNGKWFGVPFSVVVLNACTSMILFINTQNPAFFGFGVAAHGVAWLLCQIDADIFEILGDKMAHGARCSNRSHWGGTSYDPS